MLMAEVISTCANSLEHAGLQKLMLADASSVSFKITWGSRVTANVASDSDRKVWNRSWTMKC